MLTLQAQISQPAPAVPPAVPGPLLPRHQAGRSPSSCSARPFLFSLRAPVARRQPHLGLPARRGHRACSSPTSSRTSACSTGRLQRLFSGAAHPARRPSASIANLSRSGITSSARALLSYDTRDNRLFPTKGRFNTLSAEIADPFLGSQNVFTRYEAAPRFYYPIWGPFVLRAQRRGRPRRQPRSAGRADLRALLPRRHQRRARLLAVLARARRSGRRRPGAGLGAAQFQHRRQHAGHRQRRDRVPDLRQGRHPRRHLLRRRQRLQPRGPVLQARAVRRRRQHEPLQLARSTSTPTAPAGASASAGSRRSARCASSGASRSSRSPARSPSSSSSRSATSSSIRVKQPDGQKETT